ncbi:ORF6N domain-containing protein [Mucilaginibacter sp. L3T2-6]|uniref:ORF6N domain-containing protein n=1 Tax=Mucilaginibacter sp. L3T2-6 TaxID=3062491 RepID=UPI0026774E00|nr:ORF6N domain-containing protein [Mucilaginibacter sp. L3T2-6]MDO3645305.1 ORF6N domain-containing protein [Mucilaginibacter sp. L3T2-6]MDV6217794.1 ORF6N domain-containing protein [Mucilaginibacter sp. L3T2-6]
MENTLITDETLMSKIYFIRDQKVMIDEDLAELYGVPTKRLNEQVARNVDRFPADFMFKLTDDEFANLRSQFATSSWGGRRNPPNVFTEHGVLMLSSVLNSKQAIKVNIQVMRIFTRIRQMLLDNTELRLEIELIKKRLDNQDKNMEIVFRYLDELIDKNKRPQARRRIGYKPDQD